MRSITHNTFSLGLSFFVARHVGLSLLISFLIAVWLSFAVNWVIDALGHSGKGGQPVRTILTHSIFLAPVWGGVVGYTSFALANAALRFQYGWVLAIICTLLGVLIALLHLFL